LLYFVRLLFDPSAAEIFLETAINGCSPELRLSAADIYVSVFPELNDDREALWELSLHGGSAELRMAAAARLVRFLAADTEFSDYELGLMALDSDSQVLREAAGYALGMRWLGQVDNGDLDLNTRVHFPDAASNMIKEGTLVQLAAAHTEINAELAQSAILPLFRLFLIRRSIP
jgi:hypothetical protein